MSNIISINNCNIDVSKFQQENGFYIRLFKGKKYLFNETHKSCNKCGEIKEFNEFYKKNITYFLKTGSICKSCDNKRCSEYLKENEEKIKEYQKEYKSENKKKLNEYYKERNDSNVKYNINKLPLGYETRNKDGLLQVRCYKCKEWMFVTNNQLNRIIRCQKGVMAGQSNLYCSDECKQACSEYNNMSTYKELEAFDLDLSLFEFDLLINKSKDLSTIQIAINKAKERDEYTCQDCGSKENLHGHHIVPVTLCLGTDDEYLIYDTSNIKTVCSECHYDVEHTEELSLRNLKGKNKISKCLI